MERQPVVVARQVALRDERLEAVRVTVRLDLDLAKRIALLLGLDRPDDLAVGDKQVVHRPVRRHELADGDAGSGGEVRVGVVHDQPSGPHQHLVDADPGFGFRVEAR